MDCYDADELRRRFPIACAVLVCGLALGAASVAGMQTRAPVLPIAWADLAPLYESLQTRGITAAAFPGYVQRRRETNARRVREGDLDHLVFYFLQSTAFTPLPPLEPALSAKRLVDSLEPGDRAAFLKTAMAPPSAVTPEVRARITAFLRSLTAPRPDARLTYFRELVTVTFPRPASREAALLGEYLRVMRFVYEKEFAAPQSPGGAAALAALYQGRGLSTDTAVEAGYLVSLGLGVLKGLDPDRRIRRVLIVGPGLDLAPRTGLVDERPAASYQPWAVMDALLALDLSREEDLEVVGADINPRVVEHLRRARTDPPTLRMMSEIRESDRVTFTPEYREYFAGLGRAIGTVETPSPVGTSTQTAASRTIRIRPSAAAALHAARLDIVTERLGGPPFDLVIATNILPYFDDASLMLAIANIAAMLGPGGVFLHNEPRPLLGDVTTALGLPFEQSRYVTIATVRGAQAPLYDSVFLHRRTRGQ